ncbi:MAG TPA: hypothetical protein VJ761_09250 [Ktedonobacteraceae bacterium]|nr:hypothetical protein [Ktedonobacteraceae bacterium]
MSCRGGQGRRACRLHGIGGKYERYARLRAAIPGCPRGRGPLRTVFADKGYDAQHHRDLHRQSGAETRIHKRGQPRGIRVGKAALAGRAQQHLGAGEQALRPALRPLGFIIESLLQAACLFLVAGCLTREF